MFVLHVAIVTDAYFPKPRCIDRYIREDTINKNWLENSQLEQRQMRV